MPRRAEMNAPSDRDRSRLRLPAWSHRYDRVMLEGEAAPWREKIVYDALAIVSERSGRPPVEALEQAIKTLTPVLEVRSRRVGGAKLPGSRRGSATARPHACRALARLLRSCSSVRSGCPRSSPARSSTRSSSRAAPYKKKDDIYRMAQANKAFAHYRW